MAGRRDFAIRRGHDVTGTALRSGTTKKAYKKRNVIERCFRRRKDFRRTATRYAKLDWGKFSVALGLWNDDRLETHRRHSRRKDRQTNYDLWSGAAAEIVAMGTIGAAGSSGLPVSTTHVLSSGVTGTMAANGSGVQMSMLRSFVLAWVLTLPCAIGLSAFLFLVFRRLI